MSKWLEEEEQQQQQENTTAFVKAHLRGLKMFRDERRTIFFRRIFIFFCRRTRVCIHVRRSSRLLGDDHVRRSSRRHSVSNDLFRITLMKAWQESLILTFEQDQLLYWPVRISQFLTRSSRPGSVLMTRASGQADLGEFASTTKTRSPGLRFLFGRIHFCLSLKTTRYSRRNRFQNRSAKC